MTNQILILPCPFCCGRSRVQGYEKRYGYPWARAMCTECGARGPLVEAKDRDLRAAKAVAAQRWASAIRVDESLEAALNRAW